MPARRSLIAASLVLAAIASAAGTARAAELGPTIAVPRDVRAGSVIDLRWSELPSGVDECELLLSVDGGRRWVRISPELSEDAREYEWKVPDLPTDDARLRLRFGSRRGEWQSPPSASFRIESVSSGAAPRRSFFGEWWSRVEDFTLALPAPEMEPGETRLSPLASAAVADAPPRGAAESPILAVTLRRTRPADDAPSPALAPRVAPPRSMPLRN